MQFLIDLSNTALELKKAGLQFFRDLLVSVSFATLYCVLQMRIASDKVGISHEMTLRSGRLGLP
jgi:hypothetical protein